MSPDSTEASSATPDEAIRGTADQAEPNADEPHIKIRGLVKTFGGGDIVAVDDIDLDIAASEFVVLLGPSGCGKTTTLRCIAGLEEVDTGQIFIDGEEVTHRKPKDRNLAFVFQSIALFPHMSVRRNISFGLDIATNLDKETKQQRVEDVAEMLGIGDMLDRSPSELSGGQQQRVSLGRAMVIEPEAFLLDEPFSALDANLRDQMRIEVKQLQRSLETSMIFVTHDQEEAMTLGDKIVVLHEGTIQQIGSAHEIYNEPKNRFVAEFIGSPTTNFLDCEIDVTQDGLDIDAGVFDISLSLEDTERFAEIDQSNVTLGIRPEHLDTEATDPLFEARLSVIEPFGDRDAVHMLVEDDVEITAITPQGVIDTDQEIVPIAFEEDNLWLFDGQGQRLL